MAALGLVSASAASASPLDRWAAHIAEASVRFQVPEVWIRRVMQAESGGRTRLDGRPIVSRAGAMGLMQLMPGTWRELRASIALGHDPHHPRDNILAGTAYLRAMYDRFGYPGLFAAYNAGPARYSAHLRTGRRLPAETIAYVTNVARRAEPRALSRAIGEPFSAARRSVSPALLAPISEAAFRPRAGGLFVPLSGGASAGSAGGEAALNGAVEKQQER